MSASRSAVLDGRCGDPGAAATLLAIAAKYRGTSCACHQI